ncbi:MAG: DUF3696 domain-containing protein [Magnetococcales bacterium]|nr:DUF3696 domain-containing protein [Magnetococcales bacterium]
MITKIYLYHFKCFEHITIPLANLTLLTGLNGMGKSSVIQSLLVLRQSHQQRLLPDKGLALNGELINLGTAKAVLYEEALEDTFGITLACQHPASRAELVVDYAKDLDVLKMHTHNVDPAFFQESLFTDRFQYLQAERSGPRVTFPVSEHHVRQHRQLGVQGEYCSHFLDIFGRTWSTLPALCHERGRSGDLIDQVAAWLGDISPGIDLHIDTYNHMDVVNLEYSYMTSKGSSGHFRASSVGFGITYTLPVLVAILSAQPGSLLIMENPEAHLHPRGQTLIGELIAKAAQAGVQVIVETHSDHILNGIRVAVRQGQCAPEQVAIHYFARREEDGRAQSFLESPKIDQNGRIDHWPPGFCDEWECSLEKLF